VEGTRFIVEFLDRDVVEQLKALPKSAQKMIRKAIMERLEVDPVGIGKPLQYSLKGHRRMRVSCYRIIYRIDIERKTVVLVAIDFRRDIYDE
jgi:mRNA interferase RelE/StbE